MVILEPSSIDISIDDVVGASLTGETIILKSIIVDNWPSLAVTVIEPEPYKLFKKFIIKISFTIFNCIKFRSSIAE